MSDNQKQELLMVVMFLLYQDKMRDFCITDMTYIYIICTN